MIHRVYLHARVLFSTSLICIKNVYSEISRPLAFNDAKGMHTYTLLIKHDNQMHVYAINCDISSQF